MKATGPRVRSAGLLAALAKASFGARLTVVGAKKSSCLHEPPNLEPCAQGASAQPRLLRGRMACAILATRV